MNGSNDAQSFAANFIHASQKVCSVCRQHVYPYTGGGGVSQYQCIIVVDYGNIISGDRIQYFILVFYYMDFISATNHNSQVLLSIYTGSFIGTGAAQECVFGGLLSETCGLISC